MNTSNYEDIGAIELIKSFSFYLDTASRFTPGNTDSASRPFITNEVPGKIRWFAIAADKVQTSFPPDIDYWVDKAAWTLEKIMNDLPLHKVILANLDAQYHQNRFQLSLAKALEEPFKFMFDQLLALNDIRIVIGFLAAFIPNGLDGLGLIFIHLRIFLVNTPEIDNLLKQFLLNTPFAGQFLNSEMRLSEANCPYKSFSITAIDKHIFAAIIAFYRKYPDTSIATTPGQKASNFTELSLLAGKLMEYFLEKLPPELDRENILAAINRR